TGAGRLALHSLLCLIIASGMFSLVQKAYANSAEPPLIIIVVSGAPEDMTVSIRFAESTGIGTVQLSKSQKAWESYFRFNYWMLDFSLVSFEDVTLDGATLVVSSESINFECPIPESATQGYNNLITLNLKDQSLTLGMSPYRSIMLVSLRVVLTLVIEGLVFLLFGYRQLKSWLTFLVVNLITQGALNIFLSGPTFNPYRLFGLFFLEAIILTTEAIAFTVTLKEHSKRRAVAFAFVANAASFMLGGLMITYLPM
ncbi:MAG: hypothetical protein FWD45_05150, partial [Coriobacteriia bacterium]|nr:hypothetical protein [Coriobacteriia bacterium]